VHFVTDMRDAVAEEDEEEIKGNVKGDQASVADSNASANKLVRYKITVYDACRLLT